MFGDLDGPLNAGVSASAELVNKYRSNPTDLCMQSYSLIVKAFL